MSYYAQGMLEMNRLAYKIRKSAGQSFKVVASHNYGKYYILNYIPKLWSLLFVNDEQCCWHNVLR